MELASCPCRQTTSGADRVIRRHLADGSWSGPPLVKFDIQPAIPTASQLLGFIMQKGGLAGRSFTLRPHKASDIICSSTILPENKFV